MRWCWNGRGEISVEIEPCGTAGSLARRSWFRNAGARLGVADHALDVRKEPAQAVLEIVDHLVRLADADRRIDVAVEIDDLAVAGLAHAHVVNVAHVAARVRQLGKDGTHLVEARRRRVAAGEAIDLQRLDVALDLDLGAELLAHRGFEPGGDLVRGAERERAVDLEIERYGEPSG